MTDETSEQDFNDINDALSDFDGDGGGDDGGDGGEPELDQGQIDAMQAAEQAMNEARERLSEVPAEVVVTNHVMGLYELAAIHLSAQPPDLTQSALAIDAVACLVDGLGDRLGPDAPTMRDALNNIRIAFVQIKGGVEGDVEGDAEGDAEGEDRS